MELLQSSSHIRCSAVLLPMGEPPVLEGSMDESSTFDPPWAPLASLVKVPLVSAQPQKGKYLPNFYNYIEGKLFVERPIINIV